MAAATREPLTAPCHDASRHPVHRPVGRPSARNPRRQSEGVGLRRSGARLLGRSLRRPPRARPSGSTSGRQWRLLRDHGLSCFAISNHLVGQAVCDVIDARHRAILPAHVWGDGTAEGVRRRAAQEMIDTARRGATVLRRGAGGGEEAPRPHRTHRGQRIHRLRPSGAGSTPSRPICRATSTPALPTSRRGGGRFSMRSRRLDVSFALEVHPAEIAFDIASTRRALAAVSTTSTSGSTSIPRISGIREWIISDFFGNSARGSSTCM